MYKDPLILVTNDDGIEAPGLYAAIELASSLGDVLVAAPLEPQTAMSRSYPRTPTQGRIEPREICVNDNHIAAFAVNGSPAQAVAHGILELADRMPALCISGINNGENLGGTIFISGTVGAAAEAAGLGVPGAGCKYGARGPKSDKCAISNIRLEFSLLRNKPTRNAHSREIAA